MIPKKLIHILIIIITSFLFRFFLLSSYPVHLSMDEAAITYNAYSIMTTGKDEWNQFMPLAFKSAGDYKPPVNIYLTAPITKIFGINEFSSRFVSAFLGSLTPFVLYLLLILLNFSPLSSLLVSLWLAILPWHVHFSRASFESITALFFLFTGLYFFFKWLKKSQPINLLFFIVSFSLSVWSYHAERLFVPLISLYLFISNFKNIKANLLKLTPKWKLLIITVFLIFVVPFVKLTFFTPAVMTRAAATSILREPSLANSLHSSYNSLTQQIFDNNSYLIFRHWLNKYLSYFDFRFLFWKGMQFTPPQSADIGVLLVFDFILFALGLYQLIKNKNKTHLSLFITLFFLGPLPASLTMNNQHPLRALTWIPAFAFLFAYAFDFITKNFKQKIFLPVLLVIYLVNTVYAINIYTSLFPHYYSEYWQYGYKEASQYVCQNKDSYNKIIISDTFGSNGPLNTGLPYLYVLMACNYPPSLFQQNQDTGIIQYRRADWKHDQFEKNMLIVASPWDILNDNIKEENIIKRIYFKNGKEAFLLIKTDEK